MAGSPSHAWGQIIGDVLEGLLFDPLSELAKELGLYLDYKHPRQARGGKSLVTWVDAKNNKHDLDFVLEKGGSENITGVPRAFVESAWRRYTKHSKNKAQEIEGAIGHLRAKYAEVHPFLGVVLGGEFTDPSLKQLESHGFKVLYASYASVVAAFKVVGIDASFTESTTDADMQVKVDAWAKLSGPDKKKVVSALLTSEANQVKDFMASLRASLSRAVELVYILAIHSGSPTQCKTIADAIEAIESYDESQSVTGFARYEVTVRYVGGDEATGKFSDKEKAIAFLQTQL